MKKPERNLVTLALVGALSCASAAPTYGQQGPEDIGQWGPLRDWNPLTSIHTVLLKTGKLLLHDDLFVIDPVRLYEPPRCVGGSNNTRPCDTDGDCPDGACVDSLTVIDQPRRPDNSIISFYCSGHAQLGDGRVVFVGGGDGLYAGSHANTAIFDPEAVSTSCAVATEATDCAAFNGTCMSVPQLCNPWTVMDDMPIPAGHADAIRWYPTCTTLGDGRVMVLGGCPDDGPHTADVPLIFDPTKPVRQFGRNPRRRAPT